MDQLTIAIYLREDSQLANDMSRQEALCRRYCQQHFDREELSRTVMYRESGPLGQYPQKERLLADVDKGRVGTVLCARLDCICHNTGEVAALLDRLQGRGVVFTAIEDHLSTAAPLGRAMAYLAGSLDRLERKGSSQRVRENMLELAKTGRWLGGVTPTGYTSQKIGKGNYALDLLPKEADIVKEIFYSFLETNSLTKVEKHLAEKGIKSKNGRDYSRFTIRQLLENPVYMLADNDAYAYFSASGAELYSDWKDFDSAHGMMVYNKTVQQGNKPGKSRDISQWIVAVGRHPGIIPGRDWVRAQQQLDQNKSPEFRKPRSEHALLPGILRCGSCGAFMRPKQTGRVAADGTPSFIYLCERKEQTKSAECQMKNVGGNQLDLIVCNELRRLAADSALLTQQLERSRLTAQPTGQGGQQELDKLRQKQANTEQAISKLVFNLIKTIDKSAYDYVIRQIDELHKQNADIQEQIAQLTALEEKHPLWDQQIDAVKEILTGFQKNFDHMSVEERRSVLRTLVEKVVWNGQRVQVFLFGASTGDLDPK